MAKRLGYLYYSDGEPVTHRDYYAPGKQYNFRTHSFVHLDEDVAQGQVIPVHHGHGTWHDYVVAELDDETALLMRSAT